MKKIKMILVVVLCGVMLAACGNSTEKPINSGAHYEFDYAERMDVSNDTYTVFEEQDIVDVNQDEESIDTSAISQPKETETIEDENRTVNTIGNSYSNLGYHCGFNGSRNPAYTGRVTGQDGSVFFYENGAIYSVDTSNSKKVICYANNASSLNVVGDTLYYLEGTTIYSVKLDGSEQTELLINVLAPFIVYKDAIYYVSSSNISATMFEYYICRYLINQNEPQLSISVGDKMPILVGFNENKNDELIFYYKAENIQDTHYTNFYFENYDLVSVDFGANVWSTLRKFIEGSTHNEYLFFPIMGDNHLYTIQYVGEYLRGETVLFDVLDAGRFETLLAVEDTLTNPPWNLYGNSLIVSDWQELYLVSEERMWNEDFSDGRLNGEHLIIQENHNILEVYVIDDYVYYTIETYEHANLYRVRIDGTGWEDI